MELSYFLGHSLPRWRNGLSVMLEKKKGVIEASKLRAILLMEADFNSGNKTAFGKRMVQNAEKEGYIPQEFYGSLNNYEAIEVALNRQFVADLARQRWWPLAIACGDAPMTGSPTQLLLSASNGGM